MKRLLASFILLFLSLLLLNLPVYGDDILEDEPFIDSFTETEFEAVKPPQINAGAAIVMEMETGRVLFEKNAHATRPMASTTKIMTAILAIEKGNLYDTVKISKRAASIWGSTIGVRMDKQYTLEELLYGLMLESGNDAAIAIAEHIGGSVEDFAEMMTRKALEIGAKDTAFKTPHGLDAAGHYTTAYDLALITRYALANPVFSRIVSTRSISVAGMYLNNTNEMLSSYPGADGVKTGYTGKAGRCLVTSATRDGMRLISVVLYSPTRYARAESSARILNYSFGNYKQATLLKKDELIAKIPVRKGKSGFVELIADNEVKLPLRNDELALIEKNVFMPREFTAPVVKDVQVGSVEYRLNGQMIDWSPVKISGSVARKGFADYLAEFFKSWSKMMKEGIFNEMNPL